MTCPTMTSSTTVATMAKPLPKQSELVGYDYAVAGHEGVLSDVDGQLFIKPCTPKEAQFYNDSIENHPEFAELMPTFMGTLQLSPQQDATLEEHGAAMIAAQTTEVGAAVDAAVEGAPTVDELLTSSRPKRIVTDMALVLENAAHGFVKPNILDVKLGVRLYADYALEDKKRRFDIITEKTTHKNLGFRIAGMRVWQGENAVPGGDVDREGYKIYNKDYGRFVVTEDNVHEAFSNFIFTESAGVDEELGKLVSQAFIADLDRIIETMEQQESRMFSSSLLFVFEGDGAALRSAMEEASREAPADTNGTTNGMSNGHDEEEDDEEDSDDEASEMLPKIYAIKIIDFAHASWTPGLGPDENTLLGVRSVKKILEDLAGISGA